MITFRNGNHRSLAISLLLHALLLVLLAMYAIRPMLVPRWYEFELAPPVAIAEQFITDTGPGAIEPLPQARSAQPTQPQAASTPQTSQPEKTAVKSPEPQPPVKSDLLETPAVTTSREPTPATLPTNPLNPLRGIPTGRSNSSLPAGSVNYAITGGRVSFQLREGYKHDLGAAGRVVLKFRLDQNARLVQASIESMEQTGPRYYEEAKKILQQGRFSFTGSPDPSVEYTITFNFLL